MADPLDPTTQNVPVPDDDGSGDDGEGGRRPPLPVLIGGLVALLVLGIGGVIATSGDGTTTTTTTAAPTTTTTTEPPPPAPLTGVPLEDDELRASPALVIKIDNHNERARPPAGLNSADVVYEEQVESGVTRLAAVFHSRNAERLGPVRSGRTTDIFLTSNLNTPLFGFSGANPATAAEIAAADVVDVRWDNRPNLYRRDGNRPAPHNLFTNSVTLRASSDRGGTPPALFDFLAAGVEPDGEAVGVVDVSFGSGAYRARWTWDAAAAGWRREQNGTAHVDEARVQVVATNVIVQVVPYLTRFGNPEAQLIGEGDAWVFSGGTVRQGRWTRPSQAARTEFTDLAGRPIALVPGVTWVELPQVGRPPTFS